VLLQCVLKIMCERVSVWVEPVMGCCERGKRLETFVANDFYNILTGDQLHQY
jgi:hypothetical protein